MANGNEKTCRRCGKTEDSSKFPPHAETRDRLSAWCRSCHAKAKRIRRWKGRAEALLAEAAERDREAAATEGWRADNAKSSAEALRREARKALARMDGA